MKLPKSVHQALLAQIKNELQAHYNYLGMSAHFEQTAYDGFAKWMAKQSAEEYTHAMKIYAYLRDRNAAITLQTIDAPKCEYGARPIEVFKTSLKQEEGVSAQINAIYELALKEKDYNSLEFLTWFLKEQVEEENTVSDFIDRLELAGTDAAALLRLDAEAGMRE